jgi:hypothetical protein
MGRDSDAMQKVFTLSLKEIEDALKGDRKITDNTRLAASTLLSYAKIKGSDIQEKALELAIKDKAQKSLVA